MNTTDLCLFLSRALNLDSDFQNFVSENLKIDTKNSVHLSVGINKNITDWSKISPFVILNPAMFENNNMQSIHTIGLLIGLNDKNVNHDGMVYYLNALPLLNNFLEQIYLSFEKVIPALADYAAIDKYESEVVQDNFPLVYISSIITINIPHIIGR